MHADRGVLSEVNLPFVTQRLPHQFSVKMQEQAA